MKGALVLVLLMLPALAAFAACGGPDKPPLLPDGPDMTSPEGGTPPAPTTPAK
jgi:hypothetical protein